MLNSGLSQGYDRIPPDSHSRLTWKGAWLLPPAANMPTATGGI
ncbi:hypothetical protein SeGA_0472, partial [Salmonella enterica subsp. enterica serovar Gaminara str. A4-567]